MMSFSFEKTGIEGVFRIRPHVYSDERGTYKKYYEKHVFAEHGIMEEFSESSDLISQKGSLRGLHYQTIDSQAKLVHVVFGKIYDVALDLRTNSATFGKYHAEILDAAEDCAIYIPRGFAHGYISLTEESVFSYQSAGRYIPEACGGIRWDDPELAIPWPLKEYGIEHVIATEKDKNWPTLRTYMESL